MLAKGVGKGGHKCQAALGSKGQPIRACGAVRSVMWAEETPTPALSPVSARQGYRGPRRWARVPRLDRTDPSLADMSPGRKGTYLFKRK